MEVVRPRWETIEELHSYLSGHLTHTKDIRYQIINEALTANYDKLSLVEQSVYRLACRFSETNKFVYVAAIVVTGLYSQMFCPLPGPSISETLQEFFDIREIDRIFQLRDYILEYPKLAYLNINFDEFGGVMSRLPELLKIAEYRVFWKDPEPPLYVRTMAHEKASSMELRPIIREAMMSAVEDCLKKHIRDEIRDCTEGQLLKALRKDLKDELNDLWKDQQALVLVLVQLLEEIKQDVKKAAMQETLGEGDKQE